ncbi:MAG: hypothetical protein HY432_00005 [Candidatus Liptonbacteria bacterium]|nr:hypothetical protein [Candidatus Liptonbacteria bacterium]
MTNSDPLEKLIVTEAQAINRQELADLLSPYLSIDKETRSFHFSSEFRELPNAEKILVILSAVKARALVLDTTDETSPTEIIKMDIMPTGSVKGTLKTLADSKDIKVENGKYHLPNYKIHQVVARLTKKKKI